MAIAAVLKTAVPQGTSGFESLALRTVRPLRAPGPQSAGPRGSPLVAPVDGSSRRSQLCGAFRDSLG